MATIRTRGNTCQAIIRRQGHEPLYRTFKTKEEAEEWAKKIEPNLDPRAYRGRLFLPRETCYNFKINKKNWSSYIDHLAMGTDNWVRRAWRQLRVNGKARASKKGAKYTITQDDFYNLIKRSYGYCEVSGLPFSDYNPNGSRTGPYRPSVDRINPIEGYTSENTRLVCYAVNTALGDWGICVLYDIAHAVISGMKHKI